MTDLEYEAIKEVVARELAEKLQRPAVIASESGVSSVKLNTTAKGFTQTEVHIYHDDPHEAARLANEIYEALLAKWGAPQA